MHHWLDFLAHVIVLVFDFHGAAAGIFHVCLAHKMFDLTFAAFEARAVVVAYDICEGCLFYASFNPYKMVESFVAFCVLGCFPAREHGAMR